VNPSDPGACPAPTVPRGPPGGGGSFFRVPASRGGLRWPQDWIEANPGRRALGDPSEPGLCACFPGPRPRCGAVGNKTTEEPGDQPPAGSRRGTGGGPRFGFRSSAQPGAGEKTVRFSRGMGGAANTFVQQAGGAQTGTKKRGGRGWNRSVWFFAESDDGGARGPPSRLKVRTNRPAPAPRRGPGKPVRSGPARRIHQAGFWAPVGNVGWRTEGGGVGG